MKSGGDHAFYTLHVDGQQTAIFTKLSGGTDYKEYGDNLLGKMAKQLKVSKEDLFSLIDCDLDASGYRKKLSDKELVAPEKDK